MRHPSFLGLREDKRARDVVLDPAAGDRAADAQVAHALDFASFRAAT